MIEIDGLTKRCGDKIAVDGLSFVVEPGVVTGFLGPNGAGKSTTMQMSKRGRKGSFSPNGVGERLWRHPALRECRRRGGHRSGRGSPGMVGSRQ
jgi:ABC-type hemin transport system ATPase subunit